MCLARLVRRDRPFAGAHLGLAEQEACLAGCILASKRNDNNVEDIIERKLQD